MYKRLLTICLLAATMFTLSCSKDDKDNEPVTHTVLFKAEALPGGNIQAAVYGVDGDTHTATDLSGTTWSSPTLTAPAGAFNANIVVNASGASDATILKVQIYVDGELKKEESSTPGRIVSVTTGYQF